MIGRVGMRVLGAVAGVAAVAVAAAGAWLGQVVHPVVSLVPVVVAACVWMVVAVWVLSRRARRRRAARLSAQAALYATMRPPVQLATLDSFRSRPARGGSPWPAAVTGSPAPGCPHRRPAPIQRADGLPFGVPRPPQPWFDGPTIPALLLPGYVAGECGHRMAESQWRAGFRTCERCPRGEDRGEDR